MNIVSLDGKALKTIAKLKETKNVEVILQAKGNQKKLLQKCAELAKMKKSHSKATQTEKKKHGRIEKRTVSIFHKGKYDLGDTWNESVRAIIKIERKTKLFNIKAAAIDKIAYLV